MGHKFADWVPQADHAPASLTELRGLVRANRGYREATALDYGDHGLVHAVAVIEAAIRANKRIALYADYDVDGTMSCVSWIWFLRAIGYHNFVHYIPCRMREGYGVNLNAIKHLVEDQGAHVIITMDTGITANTEAAYCKERGVEFICTDHHKIQPDKMPDCIIVNPKQHPDDEYQELCGCGITFVLLRKLGQRFQAPAGVWTDLLALVGMATICDVVPLNGVNHRLAKLGVESLLKSQRPVLSYLREQCAMVFGADEKDVGFRLGPRINAVGRLEHADLVIKAFIEDDFRGLVHNMATCNDRRKGIQERIVLEAEQQAAAVGDSPILFLGGDWHPGVVGIAASKIAEKYWRPTWLFDRSGEVCKGSARSIHGFDVTDAMSAAADFFTKFGGHRAAGGFSFAKEREEDIRQALVAFARRLAAENPELWRSRKQFDCYLPKSLADLELALCLEDMRPFGHGFEDPSFVYDGVVGGVQHYLDKETGAPKHTAVFIEGARGSKQKIMFFNEVIQSLSAGKNARFLVGVGKNTFRGTTSLSLTGIDFDCV